MANIIKIKRGFKADIANLTLLPGELGVTLDTHELYVGDQNGVKQLVKGEAAGSVESAGKLTTARNIAVSGAATGSASFDGSKDIEIALTLATSGVKAGTYNNITVNDKGLVTGASNVTYTIEDITDLKTTLDNMYTKSEVNNLIANAEVDAYTKAETDEIVEGLEAEIAAKALKSEVYTKTEINSTVEGINTEIGKKANSADVYTKTETNAELDKKADKSTTYTKTEVDGLLGDKADTTAVNTALAGKADTSTVTTLETNLTNSINGKADKATSLTGYGITDAYTKSEVDGMVAGTFHFKGSKNSYAELQALTGMKEGDVYQVADKEYAYNGSTWVELGFNIDLSAYATTAAVAESYATKQNLTDGLANKADTSSVYTKGQVDTALAGKAATATTLAGYGITDAYTKTAVEGLLDNKADAATTLAGYQISDAYTKTEVDTIKSNLQTSINYKLDGNSIIDGGTFGADAE